MYPSKGNAAYGQQSYAGQQAYGQIPGAGDVGAQHAMASRQSMMGAAQEADMSGYRTHSAQGAQYGGPYAAVYSSAALSSTHQVGGVGGKGGPSSGIHGQYTSALPESSKFLSGALGSNLGMKSDDYVSATSRGYSQKGDPFSAVKSSDYSSTDRRHYGDQAAYLGRELQNDPARRFADSVAISQHHVDLHDRMDQATLLREQQILRAAQSLQSGSDIRQADYLAARAAPMHCGSQEFSSFGGRMDVDPRSLPILGSTPYDNQHASSILGGAIRRNVDELYTQGSSGTTYGVGLPPGRDYVAGKGLHVPSLESDYQGLSRAHSSLGVSVADERKDDRSSYRREHERDEEHRRELIRAKEKDREREERERERERVRERERRDKERERDRRRSSDARRERTPPRSTKDLPRRVTPRRASPRRSSPHRASPRRASPRRASPRRVSPRRESVHRHRSPVKEKKREYACKIYPFSLVEAERDYLSLNKRYPRLFISAECSKVVLHWSKQNLHLSLQTPVSFEHEYVEVDSKGEKALIPSGDLSSLKHGNTVWNAKVILMSGMTADALNDMGSYKSSDDKIIHFNNIIRFAIIKKDHSFMAIGGPWNATVDGGDPSVDDLSLIQTARRYLRDTTGLDLQNCRHWNRFLEIHYDRIGEDGLFSHKEITVLFVPDLSESLPSLDTWRTQWLVHKKAVVERERLLAAKDKRSREKKESEQDKVKAEGSAGKGIKVSETDSGSKTDTEKADDKKGATKESNKENAADEKGKGPLIDESMENLNGAGSAVKTDGMKGTDGASSDLTMDTKKTVKKKIVKKVVKTKVPAKKANEASVEAAATLDEKVDVKDEGEQIEQANVVKDEDTAEPVNMKTVARKKIVKKALSPQKADNIVDTSSNQIEEKPDIKRENQDEKLINKEPDVASTPQGTAVNKEPDDASTPQGTALKTTGKKKIIRRVIKKKATGSKENNVNAIKKESVEEGNNVALQEASKGEAKDQVAKKDKSKAVSVEKASTIEKKAKTEKESKKEDRTNDLKSKLEKGDSKVKAELEAAKDTDAKKDVNGGKKEKPKDEKEKKSKDGKHDSEEKSHKEKEKGKPEEPPQHPGLFLQTKRSKESKIRSMSLSLDGLLDYNDKDIEESTFELSVFAESFNEMLQYQMACRLLSFLQKLRRRYVLKKNQRKRQRDEKSEKENEESSLLKRKKSNDSAVQNESSKSGQEDTSNQIRDETMGEGETVENKSDDVNEPVEEEEENNSDDDNSGEDEEEDPEETPEDDPEENDQEMKDVAVAGVQKDDIASKSDDLKAEPDKSTAVDDSGKETVKELISNKTKPKAEKSDGEKGDDKPSESVKSESSKDVVYDKELLQAFRYFDYNRVGYMKVEDLRCLLHDLGMFLSHRDVKELVQCALFESNSARDNRIFYRKLVKLTDN